MKRIKPRHILNVVPFLIIAAALLALIFYPRKSVSAEEKRIVEVWNVDTFEGGKGSRTSFLSACARRVEKKHGGVYYFVASYTLEGAQAALSEGQRPDVISFGVGLNGFEKYALSLGSSFAGNDRAAPWCRGKYVLFSLTDDFGEEGATALSCGGNNLPVVAAALAGISGEEVESTEAYVDFLAGKYRYLLGTQRDICRFSARGVTVYTKELPAYCDLYQYVSILSADKKRDAERLLEELLSSQTQGMLSGLGMFPAAEKGAERTVGAFASNETLTQLAQGARAGEGANFLNKFLKTV